MIKIPGRRLVESRAEAMERTWRDGAAFCYEASTDSGGVVCFQKIRADVIQEIFMAETGLNDRGPRWIRDTSGEWHVEGTPLRGISRRQADTNGGPMIDDRQYSVVSDSGFRRGSMLRGAALALAESHAAEWKQSGRTVRVHVYFSDGSVVATFPDDAGRHPVDGWTSNQEPDPMGYPTRPTWRVGDRIKSKYARVGGAVLKVQWSVTFGTWGYMIQDVAGPIWIYEHSIDVVRM